MNSVLQLTHSISNDLVGNKNGQIRNISDLPGLVTPPEANAKTAGEPAGLTRRHPAPGDVSNDGIKVFPRAKKKSLYSASYISGLKPKSYFAFRMPTRRSVKTDFQILNYESVHQPWFEKLNRQWIEKYFSMEPLDYLILQDPEEHILKPGGKILMASCKDTIVGTVALKFIGDGVYELTKMAVDEDFQGLKIGYALGATVIEQAKQLGAKRIFLYSNTKLRPAVGLYYKLGFQEIPVDGPYKRTDIKMELMID
jgi:GNAT superfamily N-acetyltransferase